MKTLPASDGLLARRGNIRDSVRFVVRTAQVGEGPNPLSAGGNGTENQGFSKMGHHLHLPIRCLAKGLKDGRLRESLPPLVGQPVKTACAFQTFEFRPDPSTYLAGA